MGHQDHSMCGVVGLGDRGGMQWGCGGLHLHVLVQELSLGGSVGWASGELEGALWLN